MARTIFRSKIHRTTMTMAELYYEGSITAGKELLEAADILPYKKVQVMNQNTGSLWRPVLWKARQEAE